MSIAHALLLITILFSLNSHGFEKNDITEKLARAKLILHYPFDIGTLDASGNNIHANNNGATLGLNRYGNIGSYLFDGIDDYIEIINPDRLSFHNESFSISLWVKIQDDNNTYKTFLVLSNKKLMPRFEIMKARSGWNNGPLYIQLAQDKNNISTVKSKKNGHQLPKDKWMHIVGIVDYKNLKLSFYINAKLQGSVALIKYYKLPRKDLIARVGRSSSINKRDQQLHRGSIDDFRIYKGVLSDGQILSLYNE